MTSLEDTLKNFQAYVLGKHNEIEEEIVGVDSEFRQTRLHVYQNAYSLRLVEVLSIDFAAVKKLAGETAFDVLARDYIQSFPSEYFSVRYFGDRFVAFLRDHARQDPLWIEMAMLEWILGNALDAKDASHLSFDEMAKLPPENWDELKLTTHPSLSVQPFFYHNVPTLWQYLMEKVKEKPENRWQPTPTYWLIWRFRQQCHFRAVDANQLLILQSLQAGEAFSVACTQLCERMSEAEAVPLAAQTLRTWIEEGIFSEYSV